MAETGNDNQNRKVAITMAVCAIAILVAGLLPIWAAFRMAAPQAAIVALPQPDMKLRIIANERQLVRLVGKVSVERVREIFSLYDYALEDVREGEAVPPIFVRAVPGDIDEVVDTDVRKKVFAQTVLPLILRTNAEIAADRKRLLSLISASGGDLGDVGMRDRRWLGKLADRYGLGEIDLELLQRRVDIVPPSLALAQAANESGWGTSRFARQGNALFGQWVWNTEDGIEPENPQDTGKAYSVRSFPDLAGSVDAYVHNLNTHRAYYDFRSRRAQQRANGERPDGLALAGTLLAYSQRGEDYVEELRGMIRFNDYDVLDSARLTTMSAAAAGV